MTSHRQPPTATPRQSDAVPGPSCQGGSAAPPVTGTLAKGDWDALVRLFAAANPLRASHWNPRTGEVFTLPRGKERRARAEAFEQRLMNEEDWIEVPGLESDDAYALAIAFAATLQPGRGKAAVQQALAGPKPFRVLRHVLAGAPGLARRYDRMIRQEAELRLAEVCLGLELRLADKRFATALERLLAADEPQEDDDEEILDEDGSPFQIQAPRAATIRRSITALSIGQHDDDEDDD